MTQPYCFSEAYFALLLNGTRRDGVYPSLPSALAVSQELLVNTGYRPRSLHSLHREKEGTEKKRDIMFLFSCNRWKSLGYHHT